jgi:hypothetical protein
MEDPLDGVFVIGSRKDLLDDELASARDNNRVVTEISVLVKNAGILLVYADGVLDGADTAVASRELGIEVVDGALAVAAQGQTVGHVASAIFAEIEGVLALVRVLRVSTVTKG